MQKRKIVTGALALAMGLSTISPVMATSSEDTPVVEKTDVENKASIADHKTNLVVHKYYGVGLKELPQIINKRGIKDFDAKGLEAYGKEAKEKYGEVKFTIYKLEDPNDKNTLVQIQQKVNVGEDGTATNNAIPTINEDKTQATVNGETYKMVKVGEEKAIGDDGTLTFEGLDNGTYILVETTSNKNFIPEAGLAVPSLISLPLANEKGDGFEGEAHTVPKNNVTETPFTFRKYKNAKGEDKLLAGAEFQLYKGIPGSGEKVGDPIETNEKGEIVFEGLTTGDYYLVETKVPDNEAKLYISPFAQNDEHNQLRFSIGELGVENYSAELINYERPDAEKRVNDGRHDDKAERNRDGEHVSEGNHRHNFNRGDAVPFIESGDIPADVMGGQEMKVGDETRIQTPAGRLNFVDIPGKKLEIVGEGTLSQKLGLKVTAKGPGEDAKEEVLEEGKDYKVVEHNVSKGEGKDKVEYKGFKIDFIVREGYKYTPYKGAETLTINTVSEKVAKLAGGKFTAKYNMSLTQDAKPDEIIENEMTYTYNNSPDLDTAKDHVVKDKDNVETYGKKFKKTTTKAKGLLEDKESGIEGAKFHVYREVDGYDVETNTVNKELGGKQYLLFKDGKQSWSETIKDNTIPKDALELVSGKDGLFAVEGLEKGKYFLKEFYAPEGQQLNDKPLEFEADQGTYEGEGAEIAHFVNRGDNDLPFTGTQFIITTVGISVISYAVSKKMKKKKESEELTY